MQNGLYLGHRRAVHSQHGRQPGATARPRPTSQPTLQGDGREVGCAPSAPTMSAPCFGTLRESDEHRRQGPEGSIVADGECQPSPASAAFRPQDRGPSSSGGERVVAQRAFGVDDEVCTGDHSCIRLFGLPVAGGPSPAPIRLRSDPVAHVNNGCVGCGLCGEVADAAVLCPFLLQGRHRGRTPPGGTG